MVSTNTALPPMTLDQHIDWEEVFEYLPGLIVELKSCPGTYDIIASYDLMMVPPIELVKDPCPRYPHELRIVSRAAIKACSLRPKNSLKQQSAVFEFVR